MTHVEQFISWSGSSLLRVHSGSGLSYFKAVPDSWRHEAPLTAMFAERFPDVVPRPVAIDEDRGWIVLEDFGDTVVGEMGLEHWDGALDALLVVQRGGVPLTSSLLRAGCSDRQPARLARQIEDLAEGRLGDLPNGYAGRLRGAIPRLKELCVELEESPIPSTVVHGDFHAGNVVLHDGRYLIFDWTDACIAHPFVDLATYFYLSHAAVTDATTRQRLRDRYLAGWSDLMPHGDAVQLFERTEPVTAMHHAINYQAILQELDPDQRWEWSEHLPEWLDQALGSLYLST